jgi:hypothetical protein
MQVIMLSRFIHCIMYEVIELKDSQQRVQMVSLIARDRAESDSYSEQCCNIQLHQTHFKVTYAQTEETKMAKKRNMKAGR